MAKPTINFTDYEMKGKKCKKTQEWEVKESGEVGHLFKAKSGMEALRKYKKKYGPITSRVVNIRRESKGKC